MVDVALQQEEELDMTLRKNKASKQLVWLGVIGIVMAFAGLTSGYVVSRSDVLWVSISPPSIFWLSTLVILASSGTIYLADRAAKAGDKSKTTLWVGLTFVLGIIFSVSQFKGWGELISYGNHLTGTPILEVKGEYGTDYTLCYNGVELMMKDGKYYSPDDQNFQRPLNDLLDLGSSNTASSYFYIITGLHLVHLFAGLIVLIVLIFRSKNGAYTNGQTIGLQLGSIYWHFLGILWLYLFGFLYFIR